MEDLEPETFDELTDWHPMMQPALDFLKQKELGLAPERAALPYALREAIQLVDSEIKGQQDKRREEDRRIREAQKSARERL